MLPFEGDNSICCRTLNFLFVCMSELCSWTLDFVLRYRYCYVMEGHWTAARALVMVFD